LAQLQIEMLTSGYRSADILNEITLYVEKGEIVSLIGPNGAGKTTIFNVISGFLKKSEGTIGFDGEELEKMRPHRIAERGLIRTFQITSLFSNLSVFDNLRTGHHLQEKVRTLDSIFNTKRNRRVEKETTEKSLEILRFIELEHARETVAGNLPYGEQRILEIGIALAAQPKMLLLDEPAAGLNHTETQVMMNLISRLRKEGITILLVEHDMKLVMGISDRIVVLNFGKKIAEGSPDEIKRNKDVITAYIGEKRDHVTS
jgi:branched-chain amino acid transport system ATP-binding protein